MGSANVVRYTLYEITSGPFIKMDLESAAIAKLAINVFVTMKIGFANALAHLCDAYKGDVDKVLLAVGYDTRIGRKSLTAGAGFGGPCFPRDTSAFAAAGGALGDAVIEMNDEHLGYVIRRIIQRDSSAIGVAGVSFMVLGREYKEDTTYRIESFGDRIAAMLTNYGGHETDDWAIADVVVIAQPLRSSKFNEHVTSGTFVYDLWRTHDYLAKRTDITYVQLGRPST
jgi:UDP-glucose 6-dehydrogenase